MKWWSEPEKQFIRDNAGRVRDRDIAAILTRITGRHISQKAVEHQRERLGYAKLHGRGVCGLQPSSRRNNQVA